MTLHRAHPDSAAYACVEVVNMGCCCSLAYRYEALDISIIDAAAVLHIAVKCSISGAAAGLTQVPDKSNNAVHASASPLEGLAEKSNWLGKKVEDEQFGRALLANGVSAETIKDWSVDPRLVVKKDGNKQSLWDAVEDSDADACLASLLVVNELN